VTTAGWPLQRAIYTKLTGDSTLSGMAGIYDEVPEGAPYPRVVIGETTEVPDEEHGRGGVRATTTLHIWSRYAGNKEAAAVLAEVNRLLHRQPLAVAGFTDVSIAHQYHAFMRDPDPDIRHVPVRYRVWLTEE
jgi:hypothetical protein